MKRAADGHRQLGEMVYVVGATYHQQWLCSFSYKWLALGILLSVVCVCVCAQMQGMLKVMCC